MDGLDEAQDLLQAALAVRLRYMDLSLQSFCGTTRQMLDGKNPPSSMFCSMSAKEMAVNYTPEGDIIREWSECVCVASNVLTTSDIHSQNYPHGIIYSCVPFC